MITDAQANPAIAAAEAAAASGAAPHVLAASILLAAQRILAAADLAFQTERALRRRVSELGRELVGHEEASTRLIAAAGAMETTVGKAADDILKAERRAETAEARVRALEDALRAARALVDAALDGAPDGGREHVRHVKRGTSYEVLSRAGRVQTSRPIVEGDTLVSYRGEDGQWWHRLRDEFDDGRFVPVAHARGPRDTLTPDV